MTNVPSPDEFRQARGDGNALLRSASPVVESFFALDGTAYAAGALPSGTKELMGLVISVVKDCEECVYYHLEQCEQVGVSRDQVLEALQVAMVGAGSVTVPLLRRAITFMGQLPGLASPSDRQEPLAQRAQPEPSACGAGQGFVLSLKAGPDTGPVAPPVT